MGPESIEDTATRWVIESDAGLTPAQERALRAWLAADPRHLRAFEALGAIWGTMGSAPVRAELHRRRNRPRRPWLPAALAASLVLYIGGTSQDWLMRLRADAMTETGERRDVRLGDGSVVQLNTDSAIAIDYSPDRRTVRLLGGEAAFSVAGDPERPFVVEAAEGTITALGTRFVVRRNPADVTVMVSEHSVRVSSAADGERDTVDLGEGQELDYGPGGIGRPHAIDVPTETSWTRGRLVFADRPLSEVVSELARYRKGILTIAGDDLGRRRVSGSFRIDDPDAALATLQRLLGISSLRLTDRFVILHS